MLEKKRIVSNLVFNAFSEVVNKIGPFLIYSIVMQRLGAKMFGQAQLAISILEVAIPWVMLASQQVGMLEAARMRKEGARRSSVMLPLTVGRCLLGFSVMIALYSLGLFYDSWQSFRDILLPLIVLLLPMTNEAACVMFGTQKVKIFSFMVTCGRVAGLLAIYFLVEDSEDAILYAFLTLGANALICIMTLIWSWNKDNWQWNGWSYFLELWKKSFLMGLPLVLMTVHDRVDLFFANQLQGDHGAGIYAGPMRLAQGLLGLLGPLSIVFYSEMVRVGSREHLEKHSKLEVYFLLTCLLPLSLGGMFLAQPILQLIFGLEALPGAPVFSILIWIPLLQSVFLVYGQQILSIKGEFMQQVWLSLLGLFVTISAFYMFRSQGGLALVAMASLLGKVATLIGALVLARRYVTLFGLNEVRSALLAAGVMTLILIQLDPSRLLVSVGVGAMSYLGTFILVERRKLLDLIQFVRNRGSTPLP